MVNVEVMRMLQLMSGGHASHDKIRNECTKEEVEITPVIENMAYVI